MCMLCCWILYTSLKVRRFVHRNKTAKNGPVVGNDSKHRLPAHSQLIAVLPKHHLKSEELDFCLGIDHALTVIKILMTTDGNNSVKKCSPPPADQKSNAIDTFPGNYLLL